MKWWIAMFVGMCIHREKHVLKCEKMPGFDMRDSSPTTHNHTLVYTIAKYLQKKQLMEWLMDPKVATFDKIRLLQPEIQESMVNRGGLMDSWLWDKLDE